MTGQTDGCDAAVVVAGLGPVGGLLAALLAGQGVLTIVVEPNQTPYPKPRAAVLDIEAIRVLAALPGMPPLHTWATPLRRTHVLGPDHRPVFTLDIRATPFGNPPIVLIDQPVLEAGLRAVIAAAECVNVLEGRSVREVEQTVDRVGVVLDDGRRIVARWLVGCDGATGTVRGEVGIRYVGKTFAQPWLVVDATTTEIEGAAAVGGGTDGVPAFGYVLDPARPRVAMSRPGRWRWEWMLLPGEDPATMIQPDAFAPLVASWTDPDRLQVQRAAVFTFHARMADRWRAGRVLLAGDAAHAMPPFVGAGLGMGIRDAVCLAWRLAEVDSGHRDRDLLDGYERERRPDVLRTTAMALRIGRVLPNPWVRVDGGPLLRLDDVIGYRWAVIGNGCDPRSRTDVTAHTNPLHTVYLAVGCSQTPSGCLGIEDPHAELSASPGAVTVVRPDRFLFGVFT